jgi:hypothetical protein
MGRLLAVGIAACLEVAGCGGRTAGGQPSPDSGGESNGAGADSGSAGVDASNSSVGGSSGGGGASGGSGSGSSGGGSGNSSGSGIDSGSLFDASGELGAPPLGLAGFAFVVNNVVRSPMACPSENWEFAPFPTSADSACNWDPMHPGCPGVNSVDLVNTGKVAVAYYATNLWSGGYVPGA